MDKIEKVRAEIERRIQRENEILWNAKLRGTYPSPSCEYNLLTLTSLRDFLDTLSEEPDKSMEEEVKRYYSDNFAYISSDQPTLSILTNIARHFAEWGADHLRDSTKMVDKSMEEAAKEYAHSWRKEGNKEVRELFPTTAHRAFIAGAKWGAEHLKK